MKYSSMNGPSESEVESLLMSPCWGPTQNGSQDQYLLDGHKLLLEHDLDSLPSDSEHKNSLDVLDNLLNSSSLNAISEHKPLPPFTGYTGHLSINGISGLHYHAIAQRLPDEHNNNYMLNAYQTTNHTNHQHTSTGGNGNGASSTTLQLIASTSGTSPQPSGHNGGSSSHGSSTDHNIVSSSTCLSESGVLSSDADACLNDAKLFEDSQLDSKLYVADSCQVMAGGGGGGNGGSASVSDHHSNLMHQHAGVRIYTDAKDLTEYVDMNSIDDIAAIIGSAIADTTVPNQLDKDDGNDTRDSWMDLDAWIDGNCIQQEGGKLVVSHQDSLSEFILPHSPVHTSSSTLQSLLTQGYMPILQNRLTNVPPTTGNSALAGGGSMKSEAPSSTSYSELPPQLTNANNCSSSPPGSVVSTTADNNNLMINPRYLSNHPHQQQQQYQVSMSSASMKSSSVDGLCSPDMLGNYPHTTTVTPTGTPKTKRSRSQKKSSQQQQQQQQQLQQQQQQQQQSQLAPQQLNAISPSSVNSFSANDLSGLLGKEKPVHRCSICNRGFLNKSNIKVHLRTHTGEKPFRCDVCAKAFRQKAHLLKHQQIHKRIGRD